MDEIKGIARVKFHPGKVEEWKRLSEEAMEIVGTRDSGTLQYEIFFNEDESEAVSSSATVMPMPRSSTFPTSAI
jgi:quinol monooxygenase YgiN